MKRLKPFVLALLCFFCVDSTIKAQQQTLIRYVCEGGGTLVSTGGGFILSGTLGQPVAGFINNKQFSQGFWTSYMLPSSVGEDQVPAEQVGFSITPNPHQTSSQITFTIPSESMVTLEITDALGQPVRILGGEQFARGSFHFTWDGTTDSGFPTSNGSYQSRLIIRPIGGAITSVSHLMIMLLR